MNKKSEEASVATNAIERIAIKPKILCARRIRVDVHVIKEIIAPQQIRNRIVTHWTGAEPGKDLPQGLSFTTNYPSSRIDGWGRGISPRCRTLQSLDAAAPPG